MYNDFETFREIEISFIETYTNENDEVCKNEDVTYMTVKNMTDEEIRSELLDSDCLISNNNDSCYLEDLEIVNIKTI